MDLGLLREFSCIFVQVSRVQEEEEDDEEREATPVAQNSLASSPSTTAPGIGERSNELSVGKHLVSSTDHHPVSRLGRRLPHPDEIYLL